MEPGPVQPGLHQNFPGSVGTVPAGARLDTGGRMDVISHLKARYERTREEEISLEDYLAECKRNPLAYATAAERMLRAIGEPTTVDTRNDPRLSRLFANKVFEDGSVCGIVTSTDLLKSYQQLLELVHKQAG